MKKLLFVLSATFSLAISGCTSQNDSSMPEIRSHFIKSVPSVQPNDYENPTELIENDTDLTALHFFNNESIPYTEIIESFKGNIDMEGFSEKSASYSYKMSGHKFIITNESQVAKAIIDFDKQNITFDNYCAFISNAVTEDFNTNYLIFSGETYFVGERKYNYSAPHEYVIDLSKYNIKAYYEGGKGYLPYYLYRNIFVNVPLGTEYYNGKTIFATLDLPNNEVYSKIMNLLRENGDPEYLKSKELLQFNYDLFALTLDSIFGIKERESRVDGHMIKYLENGAYDALEPFKDRLMSTESNISNKAMDEIFGTILNDGGHSGYDSLNIFTTESYDVPKVGERGHTFEAYDILSKARKEVKLDPETYLDYSDPYIPACGYYQEIEDVAFVTFDTFASPNVIELDPANIDETNYFLDTISLIYYSNKQIKDHDIKKVVVDLSCNGGGVAYTCLFVASWLSGGTVNYKTGSVKDGSYYEASLHADVNLNKEFDKGDYLDSSVQTYCITSNFSFSCGNLLPCLLKDNTNTKFIGDRTGGGCCTVCSKFNTAFGSTYRLSYMITLLRANSTKDSWVTNEGGVTPEYLPIKGDETHASEFYDRATLVSKIKSDK